jgi:hypothetical protein
MNDIPQQHDHYRINSAKFKDSQIFKLIYNINNNPTDVLKWISTKEEKIEERDTYPIIPKRFEWIYKTNFTRSCRME